MLKKWVTFDKVHSMPRSPGATLNRGIGIKALNYTHKLTVNFIDSSDSRTH